MHISCKAHVCIELWLLPLLWLSNREMWKQNWHSLIEQGLTSPPTQYRLYGRRDWHSVGRVDCSCGWHCPLSVCPSVTGDVFTDHVFVQAGVGQVWSVGSADARWVTHSASNYQRFCRRTDLVLRAGRDWCMAPLAKYWASLAPGSTPLHSMSEVMFRC